MTERYDAAIIGAGADGLAAATLLARGGLRTIVLERQAEPGGLLVTRQFHPGFFAAPFADAVLPIPLDLFRSLDLACHGAWAAPPSAAVALFPDRAPLWLDTNPLAAETTRRRAAALARARQPEAPPPPRWNLFTRPTETPWPAESWRHASLADVLSGTAPEDAALLAANVGEGAAFDPHATGSALHLLAATEDVVWRGALGGLGAALTAAAREAGAEIALHADVSDIRCHRGRAVTLGLADGREIAARAIISTLDLKRTFLSLFPWAELPKPAVTRIANFRNAGATARLLVALSERPTVPGFGTLPRGALHLAPDLTQRIAAHAAWRAGVVPEQPPLTLRFASAVDPSLAPIGGAVMTVTIGAIPHTLFDGVWTHEKRDALTQRVLSTIEAAIPGLRSKIVAAELITPADMETALGATAGDLSGGEIAPDQMFAHRPGFELGRAPVAGLYLAGPSSAAGPLGTAVAGAIAAQALIADARAGRLP